MNNETIIRAVGEWEDNKEDAIKKWGEINDWDVSGVTDMSVLFHGFGEFNENISKWDTSNVVNMHGMFFEAYSFNQPLDSWDTSKVQSMDSMFWKAYSFN